MADVAIDYRYIAPAAPEASNESAEIVAAIPKLYALRRGLPAYYEGLLDHPDEILQVAAAAALLDLGTVPVERFPHLVAMSRYGAVKGRAFRYFLDCFEYGFAEQVAAAKIANPSDLQDAVMAAELANDHERLAALFGELFLAEGNVNHLTPAKKHAETIGGWRAAVPWAMRQLLAQPADSFGCFTLLITLSQANRHDVIDDVLAAFERAKLYPYETAVFGAKSLVAKGLHREAVQRLAVTDGKIKDPRLVQVAAQARADALAGTHDFRSAYTWYETQNAIGRPPNADPKSYARAVAQRAAYRFPVLPPDPNAKSHLMMVGFPRSGTTLLENALSAHPDVETFEEIPALYSAVLLIDREVRESRVPAEAAVEARARYYRETERQAHKPAATRFIEKMPLNSAQAKLLRQLFPDKKYIFSIRHPYDVALSCFKQLFQSNAAMENFRTIADTCALYDFVMTQWFDVFPFEDSEQVCYVRYEDLVLNFTDTLTRALAFIGVPWNDEVTRFAEHAEQRAAKTPSYQKVRSGLSIGVQSSWADYRFVLERKDAQPLKRWVRHFGYAET